MRLLGRSVIVALGSVLGACGGDSTGTGPQAASVTGIAGDNQSGPTGSVLAFPLSLTALDGNGHPVQGVQVSWSVSPSNGAGFAPVTATTDVNGSTSTSVTLGVVTGQITLTAAVSGVPNVVFHATALDPCSYLVPIAVGQVMNGAFTTGDCLGGAFFYDFYSLNLPSGQQSIRIDMRAGTFDTYMILWSGVTPYPFIAFNDDSALTRATNSQLDVILPGGDYIIGATEFNGGQKFAYSLAPTIRSANMSGCREVWVVSGVTVPDDISTADCHDSSATQHYYDVARIFVDSGAVLSISERSTAMNPALALYKVFEFVPDTANPYYLRQFVTSNDDSLAGTNTNAFIADTASSANYYDIIIGTSTGGETGAYTLSVNVAPPASARFGSPPKAAREWWRRQPGDLLQSPSRLRGGKGWR